MATSLPILDTEHLSRQTFGDPELEREVLNLFAGQLRDAQRKLAEGDEAGRGALLHRLKGSARAVGALALAQMAEELETTGFGADDPVALRHLLGATLDAVLLRVG